MLTLPVESRKIVSSTLVIAGGVYNIVADHDVVGSGGDVVPGLGTKGDVVIAVAFVRHKHRIHFCLACIVMQAIVSSILSQEPHC